MKNRIISILLLLCMLFALTACTVTPANSDTETGDSTQTDSDTDNTDTNTGTGGTTNAPAVLDYDTTKYEAKYADAKKTKIKYGSYSVKVPIITGYYNDYDAALSMTFDDGADVEAAELAHEIMSEYGLKGTLMVNISNIQDNLSRWQALVAKGTLDIGSHGWDHIDPSSISQSQMEHEIKDSYDFLQEHFPNENPVTYATPLSRLTGAYQSYLQETGFIANRVESFGSMITPKTQNPDFYNLYAKRIDTGNNVETNVRVNVGDALSAGKWFIELYHSVRVQDSTDVSEEDFRNHCKWLYDNYNGKVWFASYDDVAKYMVQRQSATIEYIDCDSESMTFLAKVDQNYGQEMTLKFYLPFFIDSAYAEIGDEVQYLTLEKEPNTRVVYINTVIPEQGVEIKIVMGGNDKYINYCDHNYVENSVTPSTQNSYGYTEMVCTNCAHTYKSKYTDLIGE